MIELMKFDMGGAAATLGAARVLADTQPEGAEARGGGGGGLRAPARWGPVRARAPPASPPRARPPAAPNARPKHRGKQLANC